MAQSQISLPTDERADLIASLTGIRERLDTAGELLAAVYVSHALDCLDSGDPVSQDMDRKSRE